MATNEINKYGDWLTVPVPEDATSGDPVLFAGSVPGVVQVAYEPDREDIPGYEALPTQTGFNESGAAIGDLMPSGMKFASVAFRGVWAFEITGSGDATIGDAVYYSGGELSLSGGEGAGAFGHVINRGTDGRLHVRLAANGA